MKLLSTDVMLSELFIEARSDIRGASESRRCLTTA